MTARKLGAFYTLTIKEIIYLLIYIFMISHGDEVIFCYWKTEQKTLRKYVKMYTNKKRFKTTNITIEAWMGQKIDNWIDVKHKNKPLLLMF